MRKTPRKGPLSFAEARELVRPALGRDITKPGLTRFEVRAGRITASNGHRVFSAAFEDTARGDAVLPSDCADSLAEALKKPVRDVEYPEWQRAVPAERLELMTAPLGELAELVTRARASVPNDGDGLLLRPPGELHRRVLHGDVEGTFRMPWPVAALVGANATYLLQALEAAGAILGAGGTVTLYGRDEFGPIVIEAGPLLTATMPMRL